MNRPARTNWEPVLANAAAWVDQFDGTVTLRQVFYHLVATQQIPNSEAAYTYLSNRSAKERRAGTFPALIDNTRSVTRPYTVVSVGHALEEAVRHFRLDRTIGQEWQVWLGAEKRGMGGQLDAWFGDPLGVPVVAFGGYVSQSLADEVRDAVIYDDRPAVFIYAGDFDSSGMDIPRDFRERTDCWDEFRQVALNAEQIDTYELPSNPGKSKDTRNGSFVREHGALRQVEVDALDPADLRRLYSEAVADYWDDAAYESTLAQEADGRRALRELVGRN